MCRSLAVGGNGTRKSEGISQRPEFGGADLLKGQHCRGEVDGQGGRSVGVHRGSMNSIWGDPPGSKMEPSVR